MSMKFYALPEGNSLNSPPELQADAPSQRTAIHSKVIHRVARDECPKRAQTNECCAVHFVCIECEAFVPITRIS